jgi:hypothetical protein
LLEDLKMDLAMLFEIVNQIRTDSTCINVQENKKNNVSKINLRLDFKVNESEKEQNKASTKSKKQIKADTEKKDSKTKKVDKKSDKNSIIEILDEFTEEIEEDSIDLDLDMDPSKGYDNLIAAKQYQQMLDQYKKFLDVYLKDDNNVAKASYAYSNKEDDGQRNFEWGQEVVTYAEIKESVRKIKMNILMGGWHNDVSPDEKERYKMWKNVSKFNKVMADVIESGVGSGG